MAHTIHMSWTINADRRQRDDVVYDAERRAARARIDAVMAAARHRRQEAAPQQQEQDATPNVGKSPLATTHTAAHPILRGEDVDPAPAEERSVFQRVGWRLKVKEFFRPDLQKKRLREELAIASAILEQVEQRMESSVEPPSLPGAGLQKLKEQDDKLLPPSSMDETDPNMTRTGDDDEIEALPPMPGQRYQTLAGSAVPSSLPARDKDEDVDGLPFESLADQAMDEALGAVDAPGNRSSSRPALPAEWRSREFSRLMGSSCVALQDASSRSELFPLPSAVLSPGLGTLPDLSVSNSARRGSDRGGGRW